MSPSRTHPTGLDRIIGIIFFLYPRVFFGNFFPMATAGLLTCILPASYSMLSIKKMQNSWQANNKKKCQ